MQKYFPYFFIILGGVLLALAQPAWVRPLGPIAAVISLAFFWKGMLGFAKASTRFGIALLWGTAVQMVHLSWLATGTYQGIYIYFFYFSLSLAIGAQFALVCLCVKTSSPFIFRCFFVAAVWTLLEWSRQFILTGFAFSFLGLILSGYRVPLQLASFTGMYGLSFCVILTNMIALKWMASFNKKYFFHWILAWLLSALLPYIYGIIRLEKEDSSQKTSPILKVLVVQTAQHPPLLYADPLKPIHSPLEKWHQIGRLLKSFESEKIDLIVFPEGTFSFYLNAPQYDFKEISQLFSTHSLDLKLPAKGLGMPWMGFYQDKNLSYQVAVSDLFILKTIAEKFQCPLLSGGNQYVSVNQNKMEVYNAAFFVLPDQWKYEVYQKQILVPGGEYLPFDWTKQIGKYFGITDSYTAGSTTKLFTVKDIPVAVSICYEETFSYLMRQMRQQGAELFINMTNDVWFPHSKLMEQQWDHARLRPVENGISLVRACNTGLSGVIDYTGKCLGVIEDERGHFEDVEKAKLFDVPVDCHKTWFVVWGNSLMASFCLVITALYFGYCWKRKNKL